MSTQTGQIGIIVDKLGFADQIALDAEALLFGQKGELIGGLDPFGNDRQAESPSEPDDGADDLLCLTAILEIGHERPVNLELIEGEGLEIGKRGIAGAEIVHRDL